jgi:APA family basic amino acid/polyamine antiporter
MKPTSETDSPLVRGLGAWDTFALVVGSVIGTGVFLKAAAMSTEVSTPSQVIAAWIVAGVLSVIGALTYAELGAMLPHAGGEYIYLRQAYGPPIAFFYGWARFAVASTASIAAIAAGGSEFARALVNFGEPWVTFNIPVLGESHTISIGWEQMFTICCILTFSVLNCFAVSFGGRIQTILTTIKVLSLALIIFGAFFFSSTGSFDHLASPEDAKAFTFKAFGVAMLAALWGYDGWNNMPMAAGEVRDPGKNIPRALIGGMILVMTLYCLINLAYLYALPYSEIVASTEKNSLSVAHKTTQTFLGEFGARIVSIAFVISSIGALNGTILTSARIPFAMARDKIFFKPLGEVHATTRVPVIAILVQAGWACVLAVSGKFDQLTDCLIFVSWIFYALVCAGVILLRFTHPDAPRPYKVWGYPFTPLVFIVAAAALTVNTYFEKPLEAKVGLALLALGIPIYVFYHFRNKLIAVAGGK